MSAGCLNKQLKANKKKQYQLDGDDLSMLCFHLASIAPKWQKKKSDIAGLKLIFKDVH